MYLKAQSLKARRKKNNSNFWRNCQKQKQHCYIMQTTTKFIDTLLRHIDYEKPCMNFRIQIIRCYITTAVHGFSVDDDRGIFLFKKSLTQKQQTHFVPHFLMLSSRRSLSGTVLLYFRSSIHRCCSSKRIVYFGSPNVAASTLKIFMEKAPSVNCAVVGVVTQPPAPVGRDRVWTPSPVSQAAKEYDLPVLCPVKTSDPSFLAQLKDLNGDVFITAAYGLFLTPSLLALPKYGTFNIHPSLLPKYRGAAPLQRSLQAGETTIGVTVLQTVKQMDAGPMLSQTLLPLQGSEKCSDLLPQLFEIGANDLLTRLPSIFDGSAKFSNQDESLATHAAKIESSERFVSFSSMSARSIHNHVRAFADWPGTWAHFHLTKPNKTSPILMRLLDTEVICDAPQEAGRSDIVKLVKVGKEMQLHIQCGDGSILGVNTVQQETRKSMLVKNFANGLHGGELKWVK